MKNRPLTTISLEEITEYIGEIGTPKRDTLKTNYVWTYLEKQ